MDKVIKISLDSSPVKTALEGLKPPIERTSNAFNKMNDRTKRLKQVFSSSFQQMSDTAKNAASQTTSSMSSMEKASDSLSKKLLGLTGALAGGFGFVALLKSSTETEKAVFSVAGALGVTTGEAKEFAAISNDIYQNAWGESLKETTNAVVAVTKSFKNLGITSKEEIQGVTQDILTLSDTSGTEYQKNINATSILMEEFGLSSKQALDFLSAGYQKGLDATGDFTDSITEYSTQFSNGGASAEQFFSILQTGYSAGYLSSDKAADAFKEFRLRIQDGSKTTADALALIGINSDDLMVKLGDGSITVADAFQQVTQVINETEDSTIRMQAGAGLLGTQFEDLGDSAVKSLDLAAVKMSDLEGAMARTNKINESLSTSWITFTRSLVGSISTSDTFQSSLNVLNDALKYLNANMDMIVSGGMRVAKILGAGGAIFIGIKAITGVMALATAGAAAFSVAATRLSATAATGAGSVAILNTSLYGTSVAAQTAGSSLAKLQVAGQAMFAGFVGWELGSYFYNEFEAVRQYAASFIGVMEEGFLSIQYYTQVTTTILQGEFQAATDFVSNVIASGFATAQQSILSIRSAFSIVAATGQEIIGGMVSWIMDKFGSMVSGLASAMSYIDFIPGLDNATAGLNSFSETIQSNSNSIKAMSTAASESINETVQAYEKQSQAINKNKEAIQSAGVGSSKVKEQLSKLSVAFEKNKQSIQANVSDMHAFNTIQKSAADTTKAAAGVTMKKAVGDEKAAGSIKMLTDAEKAELAAVEENKAAKKALKEQESAARKLQAEENKQAKAEISALKDALNDQAKGIEQTAKGYREAAKALDEHINGLKKFHSALTDAQSALATSGMSQYNQELYKNVKELGKEYGTQVTIVQSLAKAQDELVSIQIEQQKIAGQAKLQALRGQGVSQKDIDREIKYRQLRIDLSQQYSESVVKELVQQQRLADTQKEQIEIQKKVADSKQLLNESLLNDKQREYVSLIRETGIENAKQIIQNQELAALQTKGASKLSSLKEEHKLLQMTSEEQLRYNTLKDVAPDQREAIIQQMDLNEAIKASQERLDEAGKIAGGYFEKFVSGSLSGKEALKSMASELSAFATKELFGAARTQLQGLAGKKTDAELVGDVVNDNLAKATEWFDENTSKVVNSSKDFSGTIAKAVDEAGKKLSTSIDGFAKQINEAIIKQKSYEQQADALEAAARAMKESASEIGDAAGSLSGAAGSFISSGSKRLGFLSEKYEVGRGGAGTVSTGIGDKGGKSYGSWQLASKVGTLSSFLNSKEAAPFAPMLKSVKLASKQFDKIWKNFAKTQHDAFEKAQHSFIKRTHYDPAAKYAASKGFDMSNDAIKNAIWSGSVQHGGIKKIIARVAKYHQASLGDVDSTLKAFYAERTKYAAKHHKGLQKRYQSEERDAIKYAAALRKGGTAIEKSVEKVDKAVLSAKLPAEKISSSGKTLADAQNAAARTQKEMTEKVQVIQQQQAEVDQKDLVSSSAHNEAMAAVEAQRQMATTKDAEIIVMHAQATEQGAVKIVGATSAITTGGGAPGGGLMGAVSGLFEADIFDKGGLLGNASELFGLDKLLEGGGGLGDVFSGGLGDIAKNIGGITGSLGGTQALGIGMELVNGQFEDAAVSAAALAASMTPLGPLGGAAVKAISSFAGVGAEFVRESEWSIAKIKGVTGEFSKGFKEVKEGALGGERYGEEALDESKVEALQEFLGKTTEIIEDTVERISGANKKLDDVLGETRAYISGMGAHDEEWFNEKMMESRVRAIKDYVSNILIVGIDDATNQTETEAVSGAVAPKIASLMEQVVQGTFDEAIRASSWDGDLDFGELSGRSDMSPEQMQAKLEKGINDYIAATDFSGMDTAMLTENIGSKLKETFSNLGVNDIPQATFDDMASIIGGRIQNSLEFIATGVSEFSVKDDAKFYQTFKNMTAAFEGTDEELSQFVDGMLNLKDTFKQGGISTDAITEGFIKAAGGIEKLSENAGIFKDKFLTETESQAFAVQESLMGIGAALTETGVVLPATREGFTDLVRGLSVAGEDSEEVLAKLIGTSSDFDVFYSAVEDFNQKFLKLPESFAPVGGTVDEMITGLNDLGVAIPQSRDDFTALVTSLDLTDASQAQLYTSLIALSPTIDTVFSSVEALGGGLSKSQIQFTAYSSALTDVDQIFSSLDLAVPNSVNEFNSLIQSLDLTSESGQNLYGSLMAATPALNQLYDAAKQIVGVDASNIGSALQKGISTNSEGEAGEVFYSSFIEDIQSSFMSSTLDSVSTIIMDSVVTPMINSSLQTSTNLELSSVNAGNNLSTASINTANNFIQAGNQLATAGANVANNLAQAGAAASTDIAQGGSHASQEMVSGGSEAGQSLVIGGRLSSEALASAIETAKEVMLANAQVMDAIKNDTEFQAQMEEFGSTVFKGTSSFVATQPTTAMPVQEFKEVKSPEFVKEVDEVIGSVQKITDNTKEYADVLKEQVDAENARKEAEKKRLEKIRNYNQGLDEQLTTLSMSEEALQEYNQNKEYQQLVDETIAAGGDLVKAEQINALKRANILAEQNKAIDTYNQGLDEQLATLSMSEEALEKYNQNKEYQSLIDETIAAGGDLVKAEQVNALKRENLEKAKQGVIDDYNKGLDEQVKTLGMSEEALEEYNRNKEYQKLVDETIAAGGDLVKAEQINMLKKAQFAKEQQKLVDEQNKAISDFESEYRKQIENINKSAKELELDDLTTELNNALEQANELGADTVIVTQAFEQQRADIIKRYADENTEAINSLRSNVIELSTVKNVSKETQALETAQSYGLELGTLVVGSDIQEIVDEAVNYSEQQWVNLMRSVGVAADSTSINNFKDDLINVASVSLQLQEQFGTLKNSLELVAGTSDESTQKLIGIAKQFPAIGIAIDGNSVSIQGMTMDAKQAANELLGIMETPVEFAKLASQVGIESQEDFMNVAQEIIGAMEGIDAKSDATVATVKELHGAMDDIQNPIEGAQKTLIDLDEEFGGFITSSELFGASAVDVSEAVNSIPISTLTSVSSQYGLSVDQLSSKIIAGVQALNQIQGQVAAFQQQQRDAIKVASGMSENELVIDKLKEKYKEIPEIVEAISKEGLTSLDIQKFVASQSTEDVAQLSSATGFSIESILDDVKNLEGALDGINARSNEVSDATTDLKNSLAVMSGETTVTALSLDGFKEKYSGLIQKFGLGNASVETLSEKIGGLSDKQFKKFAKEAGVGTTQLIADVKKFSEDIKTLSDQAGERAAKISDFTDEMDRTSSKLDDVEYSMKKLGETSPELINYLNKLGDNSYEISAALAAMDTGQVEKLTKVAEGMGYSFDQVLDESKTYINNLRAQEEAKLEAQVASEEAALQAQREAQEKRQADLEKANQARHAAYEKQQAAYEKQQQEQQAAYEKLQSDLMSQVDGLFNIFDKLVDKIASVSEGLATSIKEFYSDEQLKRLDQNRMGTLKSNIFKPRTTVDLNNPEDTEQLLDNIEEYQKMLVVSRKEEIANIESAREAAKGAHEEEMSYYQKLFDVSQQVSSDIQQNIDGITQALGQNDSALVIKQNLLTEFANESDFEKKLEIAKQIPLAIKNAMDEEIALDEKRVESAIAAREAQEKLNESIKKGLTSSASIREKITGKDDNPAIRFQKLMAQISPGMDATEENIKLIQDAQNAAYDSYQEQIKEQTELENERFDEAKKHIENEKKGIEGLRKQSESFLKSFDNLKKQGKTDTRILELEQASFQELLAKYQAGDTSDATLDALRTSGTAYVQQGEKVFGSATEQTGEGGILDQVSSTFQEIGLSLGERADQKEVNLPLDETVTGGNVNAIKDIQEKAANDSLQQLGQLDSILNSMLVEPSPLPESQVEAIRLGASEQLNSFNEQMLVLTEQLNPEKQPRFDDSEFAIKVSETQSATVAELQSLAQMTMQLEMETKAALQISLAGIYDRLSPENQAIVADRFEVAIQRDITAPLKELGITFSNAIGSLGSTISKVQADIKAQATQRIPFPSTTTEPPLTVDMKTGKIIPVTPPRMAEGGVVNQPTYALIGEGGESEAVIPLSKLPGLIQSIGSNEAKGNDTDIKELIRILTSMAAKKGDKRDEELLVKILDAINKLNAETKNGFKTQQRAIEERKVR